VAFWVGGDFSFYNGVASPRIVRLNQIQSEVADPPSLLGTWTASSTVLFGQPVTVSVAVNSAGPVTYEWSSDGLAFSNTVIQRTIAPTFTIPPAPTNGAKSWMVRARNPAGVSVAASGTYTVVPAPLAAASQPSAVSATVGRDANLIVTVQPGVVLTGAEWRRNGVLLPSGNAATGMTAANGQPGSIYQLHNVSPADAGTYTVTFNSSDGQRVTFAPIAVTVGDSSRLTNFSVRARAGPGDLALVVGFVIPPGVPRQLLPRGIGPSLGLFGVPDVLPDPMLVLNRGAFPVRSDSGWGAFNFTSNALFDSVGAFRLPENSHDTAVGGLSLASGSYTVWLKGSSNDAGTALLEIYEADNVSERLSNFSALSYVSGNPGTIAGFAIRGPVSKRVLVRAAGPALTALGLGNALGHPRLAVLDQAGRLVATNDVWQNQADPAGVAAAALSVGAFGFGNGSSDAALILALPPANYFAVVTGIGGESGVALVELYELP
jgi:hypothetical protein